MEIYMIFSVKATVGTKPEMEFVGKNGTLKVIFNACENHNVNVGTRENPQWETKSSSWFRFDAWEDKADEIVKLNLTEGDFIEVKGSHKINKVQKQNEPAKYYPSYTIWEINVLNKK